MSQKLYIDCEFNGGLGQLISMALVAEDGQHEFYEVLPLPAQPVDWVAANVIPILGRPPVPLPEFHERLFDFLRKFYKPTIVADHPADIAYFANALIVDSRGACYSGAWKAERINLRYHSALPHNALADARALREADLASRA
jgi:hypothetical protein